MSRLSFLTALQSITGAVAADRHARRALARELSQCTAAERTDLTLMAAESPQGAEVVDILRWQAGRRLSLAG